LAFVSASAVADPLRYLAQPDRARTWVLDEEGLFLEEPGQPRRRVDLPGWQWVRAPYACAPGLASGPGGEVVVTSNVLPALWKVDPATLAVTVHFPQLDADNDKDFGFSSLAYSERQDAYIAAGELKGSLWRIDASMRRAQKLALAGAAP
jgi:hypothetical protein